MGEVIVEVQIVNKFHKNMEKRGLISPDEVKSKKVSMLVDTGAVMCMLSQDLIEFLELDFIGTIVVRYADERKEERKVYSDALITVNNRSMTTDVIEGEPLSEALLGQWVLEELDLLVDCPNQRLIVNPESPFYPLLKMK